MFGAASRIQPHHRLPDVPEPPSLGHSVLDGAFAFPRSCPPWSPIVFLAVSFVAWMACPPSRSLVSPCLLPCVPCWMVCPPSRGLVSPCLPLSPFFFPLLDGVSAFPCFPACLPACRPSCLPLLDCLSTFPRPCDPCLPACLPCFPLLHGVSAFPRPCLPCPPCSVNPSFCFPACVCLLDFLRWMVCLPACFPACLPA